MNLHELKPAPGSRQTRKRLGRGIGSGLGKTSGRGHKGQKARSGGGVRPGFEGGQQPLQRRMPKRGFTNPFKKVWTLVGLDDLNGFESGDVVTPQALLEKGIIKSLKNGVKVLANGEIEKAITLQVDAVSAAAAEKIQAAGGKVEVRK